MPITSAAPAISEAVTLLTNALTQGHAVTLSLASPPYVNCPPPLAAAMGPAFKLTHAESVALAKLLEGGGPVGRETLRDADSKAAPGSKGVDVLIHHLRKKMEHYGVAIATTTSRDSRSPKRAAAKSARGSTKGSRHWPDKK